MTRRTTLRAVLTAVLAAAAGAPASSRAQAGAPAAAMPPIRPLGKVVASSTELLTAVSQVRALPDGRVLVNDNGGRKVVLFDPNLAAFTVVADTTSATANAYSSRAGGLIPYRGDSTLFVDPASLSMLVIDGKGQVTRVMSIPRPQDANALVGGPNGTPAFDAQGRLVYRANPSFQVTRQAAGNAGGGAPALVLPQMPDSTALIRIDLATRTVDTVAKLKIQKQNISVTQTADGRMAVTASINPLQYVDDWTVTSDGRVAVVRGQEYRVDWFGADNAVAASSKIPFAWRHLDDSAKTAFLDSTRTALEKMREEAMKRMQQGGPAAMMEVGAMAGAAFGGGGVAVRAQSEARAGGDAPRAGATNAPQRGGMANIQLPPINLVGASELPDYAPPFAAGSTLADADGNLWIRTTNVYDGGSVYDVVNGEGRLVDRVLLPPGRVIAGFGKGGIVYMGVRVNETGVRLEKATVR